MHAKHTKQAGKARYANQANQAGRQGRADRVGRAGKPGRAQAVATQLSPISKLDVCRSATCISSQQDRNMFILSLAIPTHWQPQSVATPLPPISKLDVFLFATYIFSTGSQNVYLFFCLIHTLAGTSSVNAAISNFKNWTSFGLRPVCLLNRIAKRISFLGPHQPYGPRLLGSR